MVGGPFSGTYSPPSFARPCRTQWRKPTSSAHRPSTTRASERGDSAKLAQSRLDAGVARIKSGFDAPPASDSAALVLTKAAVLALLRCCACPGATVGHATRRTAAPRPADNTRLEMLRIANTERCQYSRANASLPRPAAYSTYLSPPFLVSPGARVVRSSRYSQQAETRGPILTEFRCKVEYRSTEFSS
eukprot:COSAG02_NODE_1902_length_10451_cov_6.077763_1_plen_189_part_00